MFGKIILAGAVAIAAVSPAAAKEVVVQHNDLNLSTSEGQKTLQKRLDAAAREACGYGEIQTVTQMRSLQRVRCYKKTKVSGDVQFASVVEKSRRGG